MAKGRFLSCTIAHDKRFNDLSTESALLFLMTIPHLDRDGMILYGDGPELWAQVCPRRPDLLRQIAGLVREWLRLGLVTLHETGDGHALRFEGFHKNQQGLRYEREGISRFGVDRSATGVSPDLLRSNSGPTPAQVQGQVEVEVEVQGQVEGQGQAATTPPATHPPTPPEKIVIDLSNMPPSLMQLYRDASGEMGQITPVFRTWFDQITSRYTRPQCEAVFRQLSADILAGKTNGSKWTHTVALFEATNASAKPEKSNGHSLTAKHPAYDPGSDAELDALRAFKAADDAARLAAASTG